MGSRLEVIIVILVDTWFYTLNLFAIIIVVVIILFIVIITVQQYAVHGLVSLKKSQPFETCNHTFRIFLEIVVKLSDVVAN